MCLGHALLHAPEAHATAAETLIGSSTRNGKRLTYGGDGHTTTLICGHYDYDRAGLHPVLSALPPVLHLKQGLQSAWMVTASRLTVLESNDRTQGSNAIVDRLAEALLIQVIRAYAQRLHNGSGFLAALGDPALARALSLMHERPAHNWRLDELARDCGVSKTVLVCRFNDTLGMAPMQYLTRWRMHKARNMLHKQKRGTGSRARWL